MKKVSWHVYARTKRSLSHYIEYYFTAHGLSSFCMNIDTYKCIIMHNENILSRSVNRGRKWSRAKYFLKQPTKNAWKYEKWSINLSKWRWNFSSKLYNIIWLYSVTDFNLKRAGTAKKCQNNHRDWRRSIVQKSGRFSCISHNRRCSFRFYPWNIILASSMWAIPSVLVFPLMSRALEFISHWSDVFISFDIYFSMVGRESLLETLASTRIDHFRVAVLFVHPPLLCTVCCHRISTR